MDELILIFGASLILLLFLCLSTSLRYLNFSQLQVKFNKEGYEALLKQLENRDDIEIISECFVLLMAILQGALIYQLCGQANALFFISIAGMALVVVALRVGLISAWAETLLVELMPLYNLLESIPFAVKITSSLRRLGQYLAGESDHESHNLELEHLLHEGEAEGSVDSEEKAMLEGVIELKNMVVREIMTPWTEVEYLNDEATVREGIAHSAEKGVSRLPIYDSSRDKVEGVFFVRDILESVAQDRDILDEPIIKYMRQVPMVPESRFARNLLVTMSKSRNQMLLILDEYGSLTGLVTLEDILEEIVGDIRDEYVEDDEEIDIIDDNTAVVLGGTRLEEVNEELSLKLTEGRNFESLAGYLLNKLQRIPRKGEKFEFEGCRFSILVATARRIVKIRVEKLTKLDTIPSLEKTRNDK